MKPQKQLHERGGRRHPCSADRPQRAPPSRKSTAHKHAKRETGHPCWRIPGLPKEKDQAKIKNRAGTREGSAREPRRLEGAYRLEERSLTERPGSGRSATGRRGLGAPLRRKARDRSAAPPKSSSSNRASEERRPKGAPYFSAAFADFAAFAARASSSALSAALYPPAP